MSLLVHSLSRRRPVAFMQTRYAAFRRSALGEALETVGIAVLVAFVVRLFVFQAFYIPSRSMAETLVPKDHILAEKLTYLVRDPARGEIVIFDFGDEIDAPAMLSRPAMGAAAAAAIEEPHEYVKRVIAVAGDEIRFSGGRLQVNGVTQPGLVPGAFAFRISGRRIAFTDSGVSIDGHALAEVLPPSMPPAAIEDRSAANFARLGEGGIGILKLRVPAGMIYVMGDNRDESLDSRFFGFVPCKHVRARVIATYWPPHRARFLP